MFVLVRALVYATTFVGVVMVFLPRLTLPGASLAAPETVGRVQIAGAAVTGAGAALVLWCLLSFVFLGEGTPAPFDPPRRLVVRGPYRFVRNPMYVGAGLALAGAALYYRSLGLLVYDAVFLLVLHLVVVVYEEPTLRRLFGEDYAGYCETAGRWVPRV